MQQGGPDQIIPTEAIKTWAPSGAVKLRLDDSTTLSPISVPSLLKKAAEEHPEAQALLVKRDGTWQATTYRQYHEQVRVMAKAFIKLGLERFHGVCILGFNSPEWFVADLAAIFAGGFAAGIYTTNSPKMCQHCAINCCAQILVVEDQKQLDKVLKIRGNLPHLKAIIQYCGEPTVDGVMSWEEAMALGKEQPDDALEERLKGIAVNQCCTLIYTSGTTGPPKGVMLSHDNITWNISSSVFFSHNSLENDYIIVSFLPLSHIVAQITDIFVPIFTGGSVYFSQPDALKGSLIATLKEVRPTRILGVPRVWEKIQEKMVEAGCKTNGLGRLLIEWAKGVGQRCYSFLSGAAPIATEVLRFFHGFDIPLTEGYGLSESTGPHTIGLSNWLRVGSVGQSPPECQTRIGTPDQFGNGEIFIKGRHVAMGYLLMGDQTDEAIDDDGWLHSGDIGRIDSDGFLFITGRIKELIITAGGENVSPVQVEDLLKEELPFLSHAMLIGDQRKFLSVLLTLKTEVDGDTGEPEDRLTPSCVEWCRSVGSNANCVMEVLAGPDLAVMRAIQDGLDRVNRKAPSNAQKVQKWTVISKDFSIWGGELGPTMKLKRLVVTEKYLKTIEKFYQ